MKPAKPILGFGPIGYALLAVALALLWILVSGYDLRYQIMRLINDSLGWNYMYQYVMWYLLANYYCLLSPRFGVLSLVYVLIALHLHPKRVAWWWYVFLAFGAQVTAGWYWWSSGIFRGSTPFPIQFGSTYIQQITAELLIGMVTSVVLWRISRSWFVAWASALIVLWSIGWKAIDWLFPSTMSIEWSNAYPWIGACVYHGLMAYILLQWSIRARFRSRRDDVCQSCGYDLAGLPGNTCPECGSAIEPHPAASSDQTNEHEQSTPSTPRPGADRPASG
jgi:hypothetical protein